MKDLEQKVDGLSESLGVTEKVLILVAARLRNQTRLVLVGGFLLGSLQLGVLWAQIDIGRNQVRAQRDQRAFLQELQAIRKTTDVTAKTVEDQPKLSLIPSPTPGGSLLRIQPARPRVQTKEPTKKVTPSPAATPSVEVGPSKGDVLIPILPTELAN